MPKYLSRPPYTGSSRKLVLAFDVGTTYSGVSYSILNPGEVPEIRGVTRFPAQEKTGGASKIPTVIYYDSSGVVQAAGAEATRDGIQEEVDDKQWIKAEWFKLHLRPSDSIDPGEEALFGQIPPLPLNKTVAEVFADFYRYLFNCTANYIRSSHANGPLLWSSIRHDIDFVLSHPNGWGGREQAVLRQAAVLAGLVPDAKQKSQDRISFVTEGEASLHFVIRSGILTSNLANGEGILIVDAGGGTVDISSYKQEKQEKQMSFEEIAAPHCLFSGSLLVNFHAKQFIRGLLEDSKYIDDVDYIVRCFDARCKAAFKDEECPQYIKFGNPRDNDPDRSIRSGQLKLDGHDIKEFFVPSATAIKQSVLEQRTSGSKNIKHVVLVGGFSANDWLFNDLETFLLRLDPTLVLIRPEEHINKAVSDGAISFYLDHFVRARIAKFTYGTVCSIPYDPNDAAHIKRAATKFVSPSGETRVPGVFCDILAKGTKVMEMTEFRGQFNQVARSSSGFQRMASPVWFYRGTHTEQRWKDLDPKNYDRLCTIYADLSHLTLSPRRGRGGKSYYRVDYDIILLFGMTELKAQIAWREHGVEKRSPAVVVFDL
ncbi:hypothetical protein BDN70DRAFT_881877 [Pholiota conissans]|uniref:Uncharacterized protein n=1 Tax=Pholiota conissans TaxID=109636 RepID=A0A9P5YYA1_9AGAR|nr:hypothetical protein BDN70DRAFT_881877 [Pholiota conissans]